MFSKKEKEQSKIANQKSINRNGFTLIEIILVLFLTSLAFVAIYALYASNIKHNVESRYEVIASNLAQEGIEIIRNARDEKILNGDDIDHDWDNITGANCYPVYNGNPGEGDCRIPGMATGAQNVGYAATGYYNCAGACPPPQRTPFRRFCSINAQDIDGDGDNDALVVACTVEWNSFVTGEIRDAKATNIMTDWHKN